jgi:hypothetical protein
MLAIVKIERQGTGAVFRVNLVANCTPLERRRSSGSPIVAAAQTSNLPLVGVVSDDLAHGERLPSDSRSSRARAVVYASLSVPIDDHPSVG